MTDFVLDASIALAWCFDDEATAEATALLDRFEHGTALVPALWHLELANALVTSERRQRISAARATEFATLIEALPIFVDQETPARAPRGILDLARHERLTAYDAAYLELAMRQGLPLATLDSDLRDAAERVGVPLLLTA